MGSSGVNRPFVRHGLINHYFCISHPPVQRSAIYIVTSILDSSTLDIAVDHTTIPFLGVSLYQHTYYSIVTPICHTTTLFKSTMSTSRNREKPTKHKSRDTTSESSLESSSEQSDSNVIRQYRQQELQQLQQQQLQQQQQQQSVQATTRGSRSGAPAIRLDMDLDVDVQLKAKIKGDVTLSIL